MDYALGRASAIDNQRDVGGDLTLHVTRKVNLNIKCESITRPIDNDSIIIMAGKSWPTVRPFRRHKHIRNMPAPGSAISFLRGFSLAKSVP